MPGLSSKVLIQAEPPPRQYAPLSIVQATCTLATVVGLGSRLWLRLETWLLGQMAPESV